MYDTYSLHCVMKLDSFHSLVKILSLSLTRIHYPGHVNIKNSMVYKFDILNDVFYIQHPNYRFMWPICWFRSIIFLFKTALDPYLLDGKDAWIEDDRHIYSNVITDAEHKSLDGKLLFKHLVHPLHFTLTSQAFESNIMACLFELAKEDKKRFWNKGHINLMFPFFDDLYYHFNLREYVEYPRGVSRNGVIPVSDKPYLLKRYTGHEPCEDIISIGQRKYHLTSMTLMNYNTFKFKFFTQHYICIFKYNGEWKSMEATYDATNNYCQYGDLTFSRIPGEFKHPWVEFNIKYNINKGDRLAMYVLESDPNFTIERTLRLGEIVSDTYRIPRSMVSHFHHEKNTRYIDIFLPKTRSQLRKTILEDHHNKRETFKSNYSYISFVVPQHYDDYTVETNIKSLQTYMNQSNRLKREAFRIASNIEKNTLISMNIITFVGSFIEWCKETYHPLLYVYVSNEQMLKSFERSHNKLSQYMVIDTEFNITSFLNQPSGGTIKRFKRRKLRRKNQKKYKPNVV